MSRSDAPAGALALIGAAVLVLVAVWVAHAPSSGGELQWSAIAPPLETTMHPWRWIVIHHSGEHRGDTAAIDNAHVRERGWEGIGYHFVIGNGFPMPRGRVDATWRWRQQYHGAHAGSQPAQAPYNQDGIGICIIGNYDEDDLDPLVERRLVQLCVLLIHHAPGLSPASIIGHRDVPGKSTDCPGAHIDINHIRFLVHEQLQADAGERR
jgi:N-acetyl-anhydromuramyl-L-alanine amidase AmpD